MELLREQYNTGVKNLIGRPFPAASSSPEPPLSCGWLGASSRWSNRGWSKRWASRGSWMFLTELTCYCGSTHSREATTMDPAVFVRRFFGPNSLGGPSGRFDQPDPWKQDFHVLPRGAGRSPCFGLGPRHRLLTIRGSSNNSMYHTTIQVGHGGIFQTHRIHVWYIWLYMLTLGVYWW